MKRTFDEISDEEWENHTFKPSKVINSSSSSKPPIESFAFSSRSAPIDLTDDGDEDYVPSPEDDDGNDDLEDHDADVAASSGRGFSRGRRFVVDDDDDEDEDGGIDDDDDLQEVVELKSEAEEDEEEEMLSLSDTDEEDDDDEVLEKEEEDVVGRALQKCSKISAELRKDLYGSSSVDCHRYAEVESSAVRMVNQVNEVMLMRKCTCTWASPVVGGEKKKREEEKKGEEKRREWEKSTCLGGGVGGQICPEKAEDDINAACGAENTDFQPLLKPYQLVGVNFLLFLNKKKIGGAILADEMGLGKTVQAITYLMLLNHLENDPGPHLVVCPASVLENWEREFSKWCPTFSVVQFHGAGRAAYAKQLNSLSKAGLPPPFNVLLVCYSLFERHSAQQKDDRKILKRWRWSCVLMDEAHALKDKNSYRWKNLRAVAKNANQRLMLTGTPLQNDLHELWSLLEFMLPDLFVTEDVDLKKLLNADDNDLVARMKSILGPFILRRLKSDVMQQLVPKEQRVEFVYMGKEHEDAYKEAIEEYRAVSQARAPKSADANCNNVVPVLPRRQISNYFVQFRKIANHPLLVRRIYSNEDVVRFAKKLYPTGVFGHECTIDRVIDEMKGYSDFSIHRLLSNYGIEDVKGILPEEQVIKSAKCQALAKLLPSLKQKGHRVLIFSQWTSMLDILEWALDVIGVTYRRLDGRLVTKGTVDEDVYKIAKRKLVLDAAVLESGAVVVDKEGDVPEQTMGEILSSILLR
ncbi:Protein CHROMATIN REMODELING 19 [Bienertia sinuspersici]